MNQNIGSSIERPDKIADTTLLAGCAELYSSILMKELRVIYEKEIRYLNNNLSFGQNIISHRKMTIVKFCLRDKSVL